MKISFKKKESIIVQLLVQIPGKFLYVIWNLVTGTYPKFVTLGSLLKIKQHFQRRKKIFFNPYGF